MVSISLLRTPSRIAIICVVALLSFSADALVREVVPSRGHVGARVLIVGSELQSPQVTFAGADATRVIAPIVAADATHIEAIVPVGAVTGDVRVTASSGEAAIFPFTVTAAPSIALSTSITGTLKEPCGVAVAVPSGVVYVADRANHQIKAIDPAGGMRLIAGTGKPGSVDGPASRAQFAAPCGLAYDSSIGVLYVAGTGNHLIRRIAGDGTVSTLAGSGRPEDKDGVGAAAGLKFPQGIAIDADGTLYVADSGNHKIRKITRGAVVSTIAGLGRPGFANGASALLFEPRGIAVNGGALYFADTGNHVVRLIENGITSTFAGTGHLGYVDGSATTAELKQPAGIATREDGTLIVADSGNDRLRAIFGGNVSTIAATGLREPSGIAIEGAWFIADTKNDAIRILYPAVAATDLYPRSAAPEGGETVRIFGAGFVDRRASRSTVLRRK